MWRRGGLERAAIRSKHGGACTVRYGERTVSVDTRPGAAITLDHALRAR